MARSSTSGQGRPKGAINKDHAKIKQAIVLLAENNVEKMEGWLTEIAADNPLEAMKLMLQLMEYNIPKLARTESTVEHKGELPSIRVIGIKPDAT